MNDITERLRELSKARWDKDAWERETTVRIPAEPDRDIDLVLANAAAEIDRLRARVAELEAERDDDDALRERMSDILKRTAIALRGPEPPLTAWSWHDLPERAAAAIASIDLFQRVAHNLADPRGLVPMLESMLACEREKVTNAVRLLTEIHSLLYPAHITAEDGRVWAFRPRSIDPHEVLQEVSDRIRELPEKIAAMAKDGAP